MNNLYLIINEKNYKNQKKLRKRHKYMVYEDFGKATVEILRLSKLQPDDCFLLMEAKPLGKLINGK